MSAPGWCRIPALLLVLGSAAVAAAQQAASPGEKDGTRAQWSGSFDFGATGAAGNARSITFVGGAEVRLERPRFKWDLEADFTVVDLAPAADVARVRHEDHEVESRLERFFGPRLYGVAKIAWDRKPRSGIESELKPGLGVGVHLLDSPRVTFRLEGGLSWVDEGFSIDLKTRQYGSLFFHSRWSLTFSSGATLTWRDDLRFGTDEGSDLKSDQELELDAPLSRRLSVGVVMEWERNSDPPNGLEKNDYRLVSKLTVKL